MQVAIPINQPVVLSQPTLRAIPASKISTAEKYRENAVNNLCIHIARLTGISITDADHQLLQKTFKYKSLRRRQYLLQEGDICRHISFVVSGALRMYSVNERGQEATMFLCMENDWSVNRESMDLLIPSRYNIEAVESSELLLINFGDMETLKQTVPAIAEMVKIQDRKMAIATQNRIHAAISMTAEERYHDLVQSNPAYLQRFSQNMIASYLGIKPETLSRVRNR